MHFRYYDVGGRARNWKLPAHSLAFTVCQVPVCYTCAPAQRTIVHYRDGTQKVVTTGLLDAEDSRSIFARNGAIQRVMVQVADASRLAGQI
jgi:hypothetical protein